MRPSLTAAMLVLIALTLGAQQRAPEIESITQRDMKADLTFLASDAMGGRLTNTPQNAAAAEWLASRFARLGLKPIGDGGTYFQKYTLATVTLGEGNTSSVGVMGTDWYPVRFSPSAAAKGEPVFVGFGISSPLHGFDDYGDPKAAGIVKGRIVIALDHEPGERDENSVLDGVVTAQAADQLQKALAAQARGAAGILFVTDIHNHETPPAVAGASAITWPTQQPRIPRYLLGSWVEQVKIPAAQVSRTVIEKLMADAKVSGTFMDLAKASETATGSRPVPFTGVHVELTTAVNRTFINDRNVVALLEGSDPKLKDEVVIVCAHYDHDGTNGENVLNGADDDGSGTVGVIEIAEAYALAAQKGQRPRRSVLFAAWNSEERGLLGAWAYTQKPIIPLAQTAAVLNMDMIGRNEEVLEGGGNRFRGLELQTAESNSNAVNIIGTTRSGSLKQAIEQSNSGIGLTLRLRYDNNISQLMRRSDHWPFLNTGVPAVWVHTGLHPDYHTPNDDADRINYPKMEKIARLVYQASWDLAGAASRPTLDRAK